jgi:hypothetical protein
MRRATRKSVKVASVIGGAITALACITSVASATTIGAGGIPILDAMNGDQAHACNVIGTDQYGNKGVVCADIDTLDEGTYAYGTAAMELICENSSNVVVRCAGTEAEGEFTDVDGTYDYYSFSCGNPWGGGTCSSGRNIVYGPSWQLSGENWTCGKNTNDTSHVWSIALGYLTQIRLPQSGKVVELETGNANDGYNESSGHRYVCYS